MPLFLLDCHNCHNKRSQSTPRSSTHFFTDVLHYRIKILRLLNCFKSRNVPFYQLQASKGALGQNFASLSDIICPVFLHSSKLYTTSYLTDLLKMSLHPLAKPTAQSAAPPLAAATAVPTLALSQMKSSPGS